MESRVANSPVAHISRRSAATYVVRHTSGRPQTEGCPAESGIDAVGSPPVRAGTQRRNFTNKPACKPRHSRGTRTAVSAPTVEPVWVPALTHSGIYELVRFQLRVQEDRLSEV